MSGFSKMRLIRGAMDAVFGSSSEEKPRAPTPVAIRPLAPSVSQADIEKRDAEQAKKWIIIGKHMRNYLIQVFSDPKLRYLLPLVNEVIKDDGEVQDKFWELIDAPVPPHDAVYISKELRTQIRQKLDELEAQYAEEKLGDVAVSEIPLRNGLMGLFDRMNSIGDTGMNIRQKVYLKSQLDPTSAEELAALNMAIDDQGMLNESGFTQLAELIKTRLGSAYDSVDWDG